MKKLILTTLTAVAFSLGSTFSAWAADKTIEGTASCAEGHATVIKVKEGDKLVTYQLAKNEASNEFHAKVCRKAAQVKATGEVKEVDGAKVFMAKKIELAQK
jgi:hypothetical protein